MQETSIHSLSFSEVLVMLAWLMPLVSFFIASITAEKYSWIAPLTSTFILLLSAVCAVWGATELWHNTHFIYLPWFTVGQHAFAADLLISNQSLLMLAVVATISFLVHLYSLGYMAGDARVKKYFAMLGFFTFTMQGIVLADNLLVLFVFWELVGFSSYLLIGHYMEKPEAARASAKAFIMNRIGDAGFMVGLMIVWANAGSLSLAELTHNGVAFEWQTAASLCIFCGIVGKSAQFPLFTWLPDAMEGPTPVSALIHAATMVAAGVYLLTRTFTLYTTESLAVVAIIGALTSAVGALCALSQHDIKKILAYSTISQLGLMIVAVGMGAVPAALLHLFTHAFFKACLFLGAGSVIHALHQAQHQSHEQFDVQDIRNMGGLRLKLPVTFVAFAIAAASLAGIPFFSGFLSKEAILTAVWTHNNMLSWLIISIVLGVSFITVLYSYRLVQAVFLGRDDKTHHLDIIETPLVMRAPVVLLAVASLWFIVSLNPFDFSGWLLLPNTGGAPLFLTFFSLAWVMLALLVAWYIFRRDRHTVNNMLHRGFYLDQLYTNISQKMVPALASFAQVTDTRVIDRTLHALAFAQVTTAHVIGWLDRVVVDGTVHGAGRIASGIGAIVRSFQGGKIQLYIFWAIFTIIIFLIWALN